MSKSPETRAPLVSVHTSAPLEMVCIGFWSAEDSNKMVDVLVVTDHFTKLACAYVCPNQTAEAVACVLWNKFFCIYGFPHRIHSDRDANFESSFMIELLRLSGEGKSHTTPYHRMGNGQTETNHTLGDMIHSLPPNTKITSGYHENVMLYNETVNVHKYVQSLEGSNDNHTRTC